VGRPPKVTRQQVLDAARTLFAERGYDATTLASIATRLDVSPAALLRHARSKDDLFRAAMASGIQQIRLPIEWLGDVPGDADPRRVLRRIGDSFVPFIEARLAEQVTQWMSGKAQPRLLLPFDLAVKPTPPQRALAAVEEYLRRAKSAGRLRLRDPRAAALLLLGSLHSYVTLHQIVKICEPPLPLDRYLDTLVEVWTRDASAPAAASAKPQRSRRKARAPRRGDGKR